MKRIIMLVLLFAAIKVAGQTTGYLRYDTVKIMKQNGSCELYIINKTKDSLGVLTNVGGGLTRFIRPKVLNDSTIIVGLDTLTLRGGSGGGGSSTFASLADVTVSSPKNGQVPYYDSVTSKWKNGDPVYVNVKWFKAVGDSATDDRAAIMKARDYVYRHGGVLFFPAGKYRISDSILFQYPIRIQGVGKSGGLHNNQSGGVLEKDRLGPIQTSTEIIVTDGKNGFVFDRQSDETKAQFTVENLTISSSVAPGSTTGGAFIVIRGMLQGTVIDKCTFYGGYIQVDIQSGFYQTITNCHFSAPRKAGLRTANNVRTDTGDFTVTQCVFNSGTFSTLADTTRAIWWTSGGGARINNNKFDACEFDTSHAFRYHVYAANELDPTSVFQITGNSFENYTISAICMRGIVPPYIRFIQITNNEFAPVGSEGSAIDVDQMEAVEIYGFTIRDWSGTQLRPAIKVTNTTNVTIGKGYIHSFSSNIDLTGSTDTHVDYMWGGDVAIGTKNTTNIAGLNSSLYTTLTVAGRGTTGLFGAGVVETGSLLPDADGADVGYLTFSANSQGSLHKRVATIGVTLEGNATSARGGRLQFFTKPNGDNTVLERMRIDHDGKLFIYNLDSAAATGGYLFLDAATKKVRIGPGGSGGASQWTTTGSDIYYNTGNVGIGKSSSIGFKMDIETNSTGADGIRIVNTNNAVGARPLIRVQNDAGELGQFGMMSSTHATLPNFTLFEATKSLRFATDQGVASGGTSVLGFVVGGYSVDPAMQIKGTGNVLINTTTENGSGAKLQVNGSITTVTDSAGSPKNMAWIDTDGKIRKAAVPSVGSSYTFSNGLTESGGTAKLGGTLIESTTINTGGFPTTWTGSNSNTMFSVNNSGASNAGAISGTASGTTSIGVSGSSTQYIGVFGNSTSNTGVHGQSSSGTGVLGVSSSGAAIRGQINPSSTSTIEYATTILRTSSSGAGANNMGTGTQYELETATSGTSQVAGSFAFAWDDATNATRAARYEVYTVNSGTLARKFAVKGNGQLIADTYGAGTHTVTPATTPVYSSNGTIGERVAPKIYTALISATAGNDPTVTVLGTNEIGSIVWTRSSAGVYNGTLSGAFTSNKTWITIQRGSGASGFVNGWIFNNSANVVQIQTLDNVGGTVDSFDNISFEIRVYP
jgi:hypothetical protein